MDITTQEYAIEVEWASKWKQSIGQSIWYAMQTNKKAGIVLIIKNLEDRKHGIRLQSAIDYAGLNNNIKVWYYPEDFNTSYASEIKPYEEDYKKNRITNISHSFNRNSKVRHNGTCTYYGCKNCVPCGADEGKACGKCGG